MAKAPDPRKLERQKLAERDAPDLVLSMKLDGRKHSFPVRFSELSAADVGDLRKSAGYGVNGLRRNLETDPDLDVLAALAWISRRQNGEPTVTFAEIASEITYSSLDPNSLTVEAGEESAPEDDDESSPED